MPFLHPAFPITLTCDTPGCDARTTDVAVALPGGFFCLACAPERIRLVFADKAASAADLALAGEAMHVLRLAGRE